MLGFLPVLLAASCLMHKLPGGGGVAILSSTTTLLLLQFQFMFCFLLAGDSSS